jgi:hypothetical protein
MTINTWLFFVANRYNFFDNEIQTYTIRFGQNFVGL